MQITLEGKLKREPGFHNRNLHKVCGSSHLYDYEHYHLYAPPFLNRPFATARLN